MAITATSVFLLLNGCRRLLFEDREAYNWLIAQQETRRVSKATIEPRLGQPAGRI